MITPTTLDTITPLLQQNPRRLINRFVSEHWTERFVHVERKALF